MRSYFHNPPKPPADYDFRRHGLGGWISARQFAIFELAYNLGSDALPFVRQIAWGEYDWTQGNAIETLIRLASDGIETEAIVNEMLSKIVDIREEALLYAIGPLLPRLESDNSLREIIQRLRKAEQFDWAYRELTERRPSG